MKKKGNHENVEKDKERLMSMVSPSSPDSPHQCVHDTLVGTYIEYSPDLLKVIVFENENGIGTEKEQFIWEISKEYDLILTNPILLA